jgi:hypothetical protein
MPNDDLQKLSNEKPRPRKMVLKLRRGADHRRDTHKRGHLPANSPRPLVGAGLGDTLPPLHDFDFVSELPSSTRDGKVNVPREGDIFENASVRDNDSGAGVDFSEVDA